jgi:hypothetical protein
MPRRSSKKSCGFGEYMHCEACQHYLCPSKGVDKLQPQTTTTRLTKNRGIRVLTNRINDTNLTVGKDWRTPVRPLRR